MAISGLSRENTRPVSDRRAVVKQRNRREDYVRRIALAPDPRMRIARAAEAVRAAAKDLDEVQADRMVNALLALAGLSNDTTMNEVAARLLQPSAA